VDVVAKVYTIEGLLEALKDLDAIRPM
jgi:hypothetical protein